MRESRSVRVAVLVVGVFAFMLGYVGRATAGEFVSGGFGLGFFRAQARIDQPSYRAGEPVRVTFSVCWAGVHPAIVSSGGGTPVLTSFKVVDEDGRAVANSSHLVRTSELFQVWWVPGQCRTIEKQWDQRYWNQEERPHGPDGTPVHGERVPPGRYRMEVQWQTGRGEVDRSLGPVVTPWFEVPFR